jgi:hypothetical protein
MRYFSKRLVLINLLAVTAVVGCLFLGNWQWERAHYTAPADSSTGNFSDLSPLRDYLPPTSIGVKTSITGTWQPDSRIEFKQRPVDGKQLLNPDPGTQTIVSWSVPVGTWVLDVLTLSDGSSVGVVRGWATSESEIPAPSGSVILSGVMQPSESPEAKVLIDLPSYITTEVILAKSDSNLHDGYFVTSDAPDGLTAIEPIFNTPQKTGLNWRNVVYTGNWIIFAIIIAGMWWRIIQEDLKQPKKEKA